MQIDLRRITETGFAFTVLALVMHALALAIHFASAVASGIF